MLPRFFGRSPQQHVFVTTFLWMTMRDYWGGVSRGTSQKKEDVRTHPLPILIKENIHYLITSNDLNILVNFSTAMSTCSLV